MLCKDYPVVPGSWSPVLVTLGKGQPNCSLFPASAPSPVGLASSTGGSPAWDLGPRGPCQPTSAATCLSQGRCGAAGPGPAQSRGHPAWRPMRKPLLQDRAQLALLLPPESGRSPGPASSPQLPGPRKASRSPVGFSLLPVRVAGWLQEGWRGHLHLGHLGQVPRGAAQGAVLWPQRVGHWDVSSWAAGMGRGGQATAGPLPHWPRASPLLLSSGKVTQRFQSKTLARDPRPGAPLYTASLAGAPRNGSVPWIVTSDPCSPHP